MRNSIRELENLGAKIELNKDGFLTLKGDWEKEYNDYHLFFSEITGELYTSNVVQDKDFLKNLKRLGKLYTFSAVQDKDFLKNLKNLGKLYTNTVQDKDFLKKLKNYGKY